MPNNYTHKKYIRISIAALPLLLAAMLLSMPHSAVLANETHNSTAASTIPGTSDAHGEGEEETSELPTAADIYGICADRGPAFNAPLIARFQIAIPTATIVTKLVIKTDSAEVVNLEIPYDNWTATITNGDATGAATKTPNPYNTFWFWVGLSPHADAEDFIDISVVATTADGSTISHTLNPDAPPQTVTDNTSANSDTKFQMMYIPYDPQTVNTMPPGVTAGTTTVEPCRIKDTATVVSDSGEGGNEPTSTVEMVAIIAIGILGVFTVALMLGRRKRK